MSSEEKSDLVLSLRSVTAHTSWLVRPYNLVQILTFDVTTRGLGLEGTAPLLGIKLTRRAKPSACASLQPMQHRLC
jgi:hypothetical protein